MKESPMWNRRCSFYLRVSKQSWTKCSARNHPKEASQTDLFFWGTQSTERMWKLLWLWRKPLFPGFPCQRCSSTLLLHEIKNTPLKHSAAVSLYPSVAAARGDVFVNMLVHGSGCYTQQNTFIFRSEISLDPTLFVLPSNTGLVTFILNVLT